MRKYKIVQNKELTEREYEVLSYVMQGLTNRQIAKELTITYHTVKAHVAAIIRKTGSFSICNDLNFDHFSENTQEFDSLREK